MKIITMNEYMKQKYIFNSRSYALSLTVVGKLLFPLSLVVVIASHSAQLLSPMFVSSEITNLHRK